MKLVNVCLTTVTHMMAHCKSLLLNCKVKVVAICTLFLYFCYSVYEHYVIGTCEFRKLMHDVVCLLTLQNRKMHQVNELFAQVDERRRVLSAFISHSHLVL